MCVLEPTNLLRCVVWIFTCLCWRRSRVVLNLISLIQQTHVLQPGFWPRLQWRFILLKSTILNYLII